MEKQESIIADDHRASKQDIENISRLVARVDEDEVSETTLASWYPTQFRHHTSMISNSPKVSSDFTERNVLTPIPCSQLKKFSNTGGGRLAADLRMYGEQAEVAAECPAYPIQRILSETAFSRRTSPLSLFPRGTRRSRR